MNNGEKNQGKLQNKSWLTSKIKKYCQTIRHYLTESGLCGRDPGRPHFKKTDAKQLDWSLVKCMLISHGPSGRMSCGLIKPNHSFLTALSSQKKKNTNPTVKHGTDCIILWKSITGCLESVQGTIKSEDWQGILMWNIMPSVESLCSVTDPLEDNDQNIYLKNPRMIAKQTIDHFEVARYFLSWIQWNTYGKCWNS